jgi:hypothetical protein
LLFVEVSTSWLARPGSSELDSLLRWADQYIRAHYELVGVADMVAPDHTEYRWDDQVRGYHPQSPNVIRIFRRVR